MGLDVTFGTIWGIPLGELVIDLPLVRRDRIVYDRHTGEKKTESYPVDQSRILQNFGLFKAGEVVDDVDMEKYLETLVDKYNPGFGRQREFYSTYFYVGFKSFAGESFYAGPKDAYREYKDTSYDAKILWDKEFPGIPGRNLLFLYVSV